MEGCSFVLVLGLFGSSTRARFASEKLGQRFMMLWQERVEWLHAARSFLYAFLTDPFRGHEGAADLFPSCRRGISTKPKLLSFQLCFGYSRALDRLDLVPCL